MALGRLEPEGGVIAISAIPGERLQSFSPGVAEGKKVEAGATLGQLASLGVRQIQLDAVQKRLDLASATRDHEIAAAGAQIDQAKAAVAQAEAKFEEVRAQKKQLENLSEAADIAQEDYQRLEQLHQSDAQLVSEHQLRRRQNAYQSARADYEAAEASFPHALNAAEQSVAAAKANLRLAITNQEYLQEVDQTEAIVIERAAAEQARDESLLRAPLISGGPKQYTVLKFHMQPGEFITQMPVMQIGNVDEMVCVAEVYEADVKEIYVGQPALIRSAAFEGKYAEHGELGGIRGEVERIGMLISDPGLIPRNPLAPSDRSVVEVVVSMDDADQEAIQQAGQRIGLQVTVEFGEKPTSETPTQTTAEESTAAEGET